MNQRLSITTSKTAQYILPLQNNNEYQAAIGNITFNMGIVCSPQQRDRIYQLREIVYQETMSYLLNEDDGLPASADKLDGESYIFYCRQGDSIIASCRYTPAINGAWETPAITNAANLVPNDKERMLQIGRLLVAPEYRSQMVSELLVWAASDWLQQNTVYKSFYAVCVPALVRFYRHFGSQSVPKTKIVLPERKNKSYRIVYGAMEKVATTLEQYLTERDGLLNYPGQQDLIKYPQVS